MSECPTCNRIFDTDRGVGTHHARMHPDDWIDMFWYYVDEQGKSECWEWQGRKVGDYGSFYRNRKHTGAHRLMYRIQHGEIPKPQVNHHCDNPLCVNPEHLYSGTHSQNMKDMHERNPDQTKVLFNSDNNGQIGETHTDAKLTSDDVKEIKSRLLDGHSPSDMKNDYPVSRSTLANIKSGNIWKHVEVCGE